MELLLVSDCSLFEGILSLKNNTKFCGHCIKGQGQVVFGPSVHACVQ